MITLKTIRLISAAGGGISFTRSTWLHAHRTKWILLGRRREEGILVGHPTMSVQMALDLSEGLSVYSCALSASFQRASHWPNRITKTFSLECWEGMGVGELGREENYFREAMKNTVDKQQYNLQNEKITYKSQIAKSEVLMTMPNRTFLVWQSNFSIRAERPTEK